MYKQKKITCGILGGREGDLSVLSDLNRQESVRIAFLYDANPEAIGIELAEIVGISRLTSIDQLEEAEHVDYVIVNEPRDRFKGELARLSSFQAKFLSPDEAREILCPLTTPPPVPEPAAPAAEEHTIQDTLAALEKVFDKNELLRYLLDIAVQAARASAGSIMLYSPESCELYIGYAIGLSERTIKNTRQKPGKGIAGRVAQEKQARLLTLTPEESLYAQDRERVDIASAISVPLMWEAELLGVLNVSSSKGEHELDTKDLENLKRISRRISHVLHEARKIRQIQLRHREISLRAAVGEISDKPSSFQEKFFLLSGYLANLLSAETTHIYLSTHEGDWLLLGGSSQNVSPHSQKIRIEKGVLSRCFIEQVPIILSESHEDKPERIEAITSFVYYPIKLTRPLGVFVVEFNERCRLEEFLATKESVGMEIARFIASEMRERKMKRELASTNRLSDMAPRLLGCRTVEDLGAKISGVIADVLECERVSVRLAADPGIEQYIKLFHESPANRLKGWESDDELRFLRLVEKKEPFSKALLSYETRIGETLAPYRSLLAIPVFKGEAFIGGVIAYDKHPAEPFDENVFTEFDRALVERLLLLVDPLLDTITAEKPIAAEKVDVSYETMLAENQRRLIKICEQEIQRSDRYHQSFGLNLFVISPLAGLFDREYEKALELVEEITRGIQTRTRKTDYFSWIDKNRFALLTLEAGKRVRFLVERIMAYLVKDMAAVLDIPVEREDILYSHSIYPGESRNAKELLEEAERNLTPYDG